MGNLSYEYLKEIKELFNRYYDEYVNGERYLYIGKKEIHIESTFIYCFNNQNIFSGNSNLKLKLELEKKIPLLITGINHNSALYLAIGLSRDQCITKLLGISYELYPNKNNIDNPNFDSSRGGFPSAVLLSLTVEERRVVFGEYLKFFIDTLLSICTPEIEQIKYKQLKVNII